MPVLPLGNISLGLAVAYVPFAVAWLVLFARDARSSLLFLAGPLLPSSICCRSCPSSRSEARGFVRRAALALAAVAATVGTVAVVGLRLPLTGEAPPDTRGVSGAERPGTALDGLLAAL